MYCAKVMSFSFDTDWKLRRRKNRSNENND